MRSRAVRHAARGTRALARPSIARLTARLQFAARRFGWLFVRRSDRLRQRERKYLQAGLVVRFVPRRVPRPRQFRAPIRCTFARAAVRPARPPERSYKARLRYANCRRATVWPVPVLAE